MISKYGIMSLLVTAPLINYAQEKKVLSLDEAIQLGLANSKTLQLSKAKVEEAVSVYHQTLDKALPSAKASAIYNHAEIPNNTLQLGGGNPIRLPSSADAYLGTLSVNELIFAGNKLKYAKESTDLLKKIAELDVDNNKEEVTLSIINSYLNLYKLAASKKVVQQNLDALDKQYQQTKRFFDQGLVTKNDVLRLQLQKSNIALTGLDIDKNLHIVNYNLAILLGLPEATEIETTDLNLNPNQATSFATFIDSAMNNRVELKQLDYRSQIADKNILSLKADKLPTLGAGFGAYYVNPSGSFIPSQNQFITPVTLGLTLSWNIGNLWTSKNKVAEATIQKRETDISKSILLDQVKLEINRNFQNYQQALDKIEVLNTAIEQAQENDDIVQSKYNNNIASVTDRIDADTQLYQAKINLEIAKADAELAYYNLLKSSGQKLTR
ncbi:MAG: TolC family protein [Sphingobacteriales bacterium]|nr:TolC family protein [Sphingobacteriales bacterium]